MLKEPVSIIVPTYNRKKYILDSVKSVLNQSYQELEVIVADDGSSDGTELLFNNHIDARVKYFRLNENRGVAYARNFGVSQAKYNIISFNDSDDLWHEDKLEKQMEYWNDHPDNILVYCAFAMKENLKSDKYIKAPSEAISSSQYGKETFLYLLNQNAVDTPTMLIKKETFMNVGGFDTSLPALEDWDLAVKLSIIGNVGYIDEILVSADAALRPDRLSMQKDSYYIARCIILSKYESALREIGIFNVYLDSIKEKAKQDGCLEKVTMLIEQYFS